jgi:hypothetical protein
MTRRAAGGWHENLMWDQFGVILSLSKVQNVYSKIPWYPKLLFQRENALAS